MRWGVVSTAAINDLVLPGFARSERADLVAVASRSEDRATAYAAEHGISRAHGSYDALLADDEVEAVYISLPNSLHGEWTRKALEAGKHVLCEKPLTPTAAEAESLFALAEDRGLTLMEAFMYRHHPQTHRAHQLLEQGAIGRPQIIRSWFHFAVEDPGGDVRYSLELAGGALRDVGCYCVSFSNYLVGEAPERVVATAQITESGVDERLAGSMQYSNGVLASFDCGMQSPLDIGLAVLGTEGLLEIPTPWYPHEPPMKLLLTRDGSTEELPAAGEDSYLLEIENLEAAVAGDADQRVTAVETVRNLQTIARLAESAGLTPPPDVQASNEGDQ